MGKKFNEVEYKNQYNKEKYQRLNIFTLSQNKQSLDNYCKDKDTSLNGLVNTLLKERLEQEGYSFEMPTIKKRQKKKTDNIAGS